MTEQGLLEVGVTPVLSATEHARQLAPIDAALRQGELRVTTDADSDCATVLAELDAHAGGNTHVRTAIGRALRRSFDQVYDGQRTGRFHWVQLSKTEKTNVGSLVEIWMARELLLSDGTDLDFQIAGHDVDCKFSQRPGGWMLPPEVMGHLALLICADDYTGTFQCGIVRVTPERINKGTNRDSKSTLNQAGREAIRWICRDEPLPENTLLRIPPGDAVAIMGTPQHRPSGQQRLDELFRRAVGRRITRTVIATVAQQEDPMKRVRSNGGSRSRLAHEGYLLLGHYRSHRRIAEQLHLPIPASGEIVSVRITPAGPPTDDSAGAFGNADHTEPTVVIDGELWRRWRPGDPVQAVPEVHHTDG